MAQVATESLPIAWQVEDSLYEEVDGELVEKPTMGAYEVWVASELYRAMIAWDLPKVHGSAFSELLFLIDRAANLKRRPDVAFVSAERWPPRIPAPQVDAWEIIPDLAVEVTSPSNIANEVIGKIEEYFEAGVRQVWLIYPLYRKIYVYNSLNSVQIYQIGDDLDGGAILPGFRVAVSALFGVANADS